MALQPTTTYAPGDTVVLMEDYASFDSGSVGTVTDVDPATESAEELVYLTLTDGRAIDGVFATRLAPGLFEEGDRVAIASPVYAVGTVGEADHTVYDIGPSLVKVGDTGVVVSETVDRSGDIYVRLDESGRAVPVQRAGLVYLGETEPTDEEVAEQEAQGQYALPFAIPQTFIAGVEAPSIADMLEAILSPAAEAEEADEEDDADEFYDADLSRRADALALAYDVLIDAAEKAHNAGAEGVGVNLDMALTAAAFILGDEEGDE